MFSDFYTVDLRDLWGRLGLPRRALRLHFCSFWELLGSPTEAVWGHRVSLSPLGGFYVTAISTGRPQFSCEL